MVRSSMCLSVHTLRRRPSGVVHGNCSTRPVLGATRCSGASPRTIRSARRRAVGPLGEPMDPGVADERQVERPREDLPRIAGPFRARRLAAAGEEQEPFGRWAGSEGARAGTLSTS